MNAQDMARQATEWHGNGSGRPKRSGLSKDAFRFVAQHINSASTTLETGPGLSTILFAMKGTNHSCIAQRQEEVHRLKEYCRQNQISTERITFHIARPEVALPRLQSANLDLALLDGRRAFLEWFYLAGRLKIDGLLLIDNTRTWTGCALRDFLLAEPEWRLFADLSGTIAFIKLREDRHIKVGGQQRYVAQQMGRLDQAAVTSNAGQVEAVPTADGAGASAGPGVLSFQCNICRQPNASGMADLRREIPSCRHCRSTVRFRSIVRVLATELLGAELDLPDFPIRRDLYGLGLSDWQGYALPLARRLNYTNTYYTREPRLDITEIDPALEGKYDFVIASEIFQYVAPPVSKAFENSRRLLKPDGVLILTAPYRLRGSMTEHYPDLHSYRVETEAGRQILRNVTLEGVEQVFENPAIHGQGGNLEMRVFSEPALMQHLKEAGFTKIKIHSSPDFAHGIYWAQDHSLPISARP